MTDFMNPWALYAFAVFVPIIILYLLRPKPKDLRIPSLMFITEMEHRKRFRSLFRRIVRDPLLLMQLLAVSLIILAMANPFYLTEEIKRMKEDVVVVIDLSASMQAGSPSRFAQAKEVASSIVSNLDLSDTVSLVLAERMPVIILKRGDRARAQALVDGLEAKATPTGLGGAILLAADLVKDSPAEKRIYVVSDFSSCEGVDPLAAQKKAFSDGISVEFVRVGTDEENVAVINSRSGRLSDKCFMEVIVKNYGQSGRTVHAELSLDGKTADSASRTVGSGASEFFYLSASCSGAEHEAVTSIGSSDTMGVDDHAYAIIPKATELDVLLVRERGSEEHIRYALESLEGISLSETFPPVYPQDYSAYEVVIFQEAHARNVLAGTFQRIRRFVESGGNLVVLGFPDLVEMPQADLAGLLPVEPVEMLQVSSTPLVLFEHRILNDVDMESVRLSSHIQADDKVGSVTLVDIMGSPLLTLWDVGSGDVVYFGLPTNSSESDFYLKPSFPIFWYKLLYWLARDEGASATINFKTGEQLPLLVNQTLRVRKPLGDMVEGVDILLDEVGFYRVEQTGEKVAASLLDEKESDITAHIEAESVEMTKVYSPSVDREERVNEFFWALALAALGLVLLEWFYYKRRGSL